MSVSYSVVVAIDLETVPDAERQQIALAFDQIADAIATIPEASPFFASSDESVLQIDVAGWRVAYRVDRARREVRVIEASRKA